MVQIRALAHIKTLQHFPSCHFLGKKRTHALKLTTFLAATLLTSAYKHACTITGKFRVTQQRWESELQPLLTILHLVLTHLTLASSVEIIYLVL